MIAEQMMQAFRLPAPLTSVERLHATAVPVATLEMLVFIREKLMTALSDAGARPPHSLGSLRRVLAAADEYHTYLAADVFDIDDDEDNEEPAWEITMFDEEQTTTRHAGNFSFECTVVRYLMLVARLNIALQTHDAADYDAARRVIDDHIETPRPDERTSFILSAGFYVAMRHIIDGSARISRVFARARTKSVSYATMAARIMFAVLEYERAERFYPCVQTLYTNQARSMVYRFTAQALEENASYREPLGYAVAERYAKRAKELAPQSAASDRYCEHIVETNRLTRGSPTLSSERVPKLHFDRSSSSKGVGEVQVSDERVLLRLVAA